MSANWIDVISIYYYCMCKIGSVIIAVANYVSKPNDWAIIFYVAGYNSIVGDQEKMMCVLLQFLCQ